MEQQPIIIEDNISVAANSTNDNVIASNTSLRQYLRAPFNCGAKLAVVVSALGLRFDMDYGSKNVAFSCEGRVGTDLQDPLDVINDQFFPRQGDQLVLRVTNPTGGALSIRYRITLEPEPEGVQTPPDARVMIRGPVSVAAAAVDQILTDGLKYERPPVPCMLSVYMTASAAGLIKKVNVDTDTVSPPSACAPLNRVPQIPFDMIVEDVGVDTDKLIQLLASNPTGGAINAFWKVKLTELYRN